MPPLKITTDNSTVDQSGNVTVPTTITYSPTDLASLKQKSDQLVKNLQDEIVILQDKLTNEQTNNSNLQVLIDQSNQALQASVASTPSAQSI